MFDVRLKELLGAGQFGEVRKALWRVEDYELELAVKTLKSGASEEDKVKFLQEAAINVIKIYGVVTVGEPVSSLDTHGTTQECLF